MKSLVTTALLIAIPLNSIAFTVSLDPKAAKYVRVKGLKDLVSSASGKTTGHEEITRQAILIGLDATKRSVTYPLNEVEDSVLRAGLENMQWGTLGYATENPVIRGNHSNDIPGTPNSILLPEYRKYIPFLTQSTKTKSKVTRNDVILPADSLAVRSFWMWYNLDSDFAKLDQLTPEARRARQTEVYRNMGGNWDYNFEFQTAHSLRDIRTDAKNNFKSLGSDRATCERTRSHINNLAILAVRNLEKSDALSKKATELRKVGRAQEADQTLSNARAYATQAFFHLGQGTHSLQDSFSSAHTKRGGPNYDIQQFCVYGDDFRKKLGRNKDKTCYHFEYIPSESTAQAYSDTLVKGVTSFREGNMFDSIWIRSNEKEPTKAPNFVLARDFWGGVEFVGVLSEEKEFETFVEGISSKWANMRHEARMARTATAKYLYIVLDYLSNARLGKPDDKAKTLLTQRLKDEFFDGTPSRMKPELDWIKDSGYIGDHGHAYVKVRNINDVMPQGVFRCNHLSNEEIVPAP